MAGRAGQRSCSRRMRQAGAQERRRPRRFPRRSCTLPLSGGCGLHTTRWSAAFSPRMNPSCWCLQCRRRDAGWMCCSLCVSVSGAMHKGFSSDSSCHTLLDVLLCQRPTPAAPSGLSGCESLGLPDMAGRMLCAAPVADDRGGGADHGGLCAGPAALQGGDRSAAALGGALVQGSQGEGCL